MNTPTVIELRRYTLHPGQRDTLIELFEREFLEPQAAVGLQVLASFTQAYAPDSFVWLRGFAGMAERQQGLEAFYGGAVWQAHRDKANATMLDSDDVLLLRPLTPWPGNVPTSARTTAPTSVPTSVPTIVATWHALVCPLAAPVDAALRAALLQQPGTWLDSEPSANNFPRLPVRSGHWLLGLAPQPSALFPALHQALAGPAQRLQLQATARSAWR